MCVFTIFWYIYMIHLKKYFQKFHTIQQSLSQYKETDVNFDHSYDDSETFNDWNFSFEALIKIRTTICKRQLGSKIFLKRIFVW